MINPFLVRLKNSSRQPKAYWRSKKQERKLAKRLNGARQITGSGNKIIKGDLRIHGIARIEAKTTQKASFSITREMVVTLAQAAYACDELPIIVVEFLDKQGNPISELAVVPTIGLFELLNAATENRLNCFRV